MLRHVAQCPQDMQRSAWTDLPFPQASQGWTSLQLVYFAGSRAHTIENASLAVLHPDHVPFPVWSYLGLTDDMTLVEAHFPPKEGRHQSGVSLMRGASMQAGSVGGELAPRQPRLLWQSLCSIHLAYHNMFSLRDPIRRSSLRVGVFISIGAFFCMLLKLGSP